MKMFRGIEYHSDFRSDILDILDLKSSCHTDIAPAIVRSKEDKTLRKLRI